MAVIPFNALLYADQLKAGGIESKQAETQARALAHVFDRNLEDLATKHDIVDLHKDVKQDINDLRKDMQAMELRMIIKLGTIVVSSIGIVGIVLGFLIKMH